MVLNKRVVARAAAAGLLAVAGVAAAASGASASAGAAAGTSAAASVAKSCSGSGKSANCEVAVAIANPGSMSFTITSTPSQKVAVGWDDECFQGKSKGSKSGSFIGTTPLNYTVKQAFAHPSACAIAVDAGLLNSGGQAVHIVVDAPGVTAVKSAAGGCLNDTDNSLANGTPVVLWSCNGAQGPQDWTYTKDKLVHSGRCLTDPGNGGPGTGLILNACSSARDDLWVRNSHGEYVLTIPGGQLCLTNPGGPKGTQLVAAVCTDAAGQRWSRPE